MRLFYDFLVEEGVRDSKPVGRGRYGARRNFGSGGSALVPRLVKMLWIPTEQQWLDVLAVFRDEPIRNRLMLAHGYDAALPREELCSLRTDDLDPAHRMVRVRAETTKTRRARSGPTRRRPASCSPPTSSIGQRSVEAAARSSYRSPGATGPSR